jgi:hypothetical protein
MPNHSIREMELSHIRRLSVFPLSLMLLLMFYQALDDIPVFIAHVSLRQERTKLWPCEGKAASLQYN